MTSVRHEQPPPANAGTDELATALARRYAEILERHPVPHPAAATGTATVDATNAANGAQAADGGAHDNAIR